VSAHDHGGHEAKRTGIFVAHGPDEVRAAERLHGGRGDDHVRRAPPHGRQCFLGIFVGLDPPSADRRQHGAHHGEHGPAVVDNRDKELVEVASERAMMQH